MARDFQSFLDVVESEHLEFKSEPYRLDQDLQKQELAKDISALANAGGGAILLGFKTTKSTTILGDVVEAIRPIPDDKFDADQYSGVIKDWVYPPPVVQLQWFPTETGKGIALLEVAAGGTEHRPYLIKRVVSDDGRRSEVVFGYVERRQVAVPPTSVQQIHALLRSGMHNHEINKRYDLIQETLQRLVNASDDVSETRKAQENEAQRRAAFESDKRGALAAGEFETLPTLLLAAYPLEPVRMRGLFDSQEADLIQRLNDSPRLQGSGWDLHTDEPMVNIHGRLLRSVRPTWKLLQLTRDGGLMFVTRGDDRFLSFSWTQKETQPFRIIPFVLEHCIYVFSLFAQMIFRYALPEPTAVRYTLQLRNMTNGEQPAMLHPAHGEMNRTIAEEYYRAMPYPSEAFEFTAPLGDPPGHVTYELVASVFEWFGFDRAQIPRVREEADQRVIDDQSLFTKLP
jgi:hypothetical protein